LEFIESLQARNLLLCLKLMATSALTRKESRGNHYRLDFPMMDNDHWLKNVVLYNNGGEIDVKLEPVDTKYMTPPKGVYKFDHGFTIKYSDSINPLLGWI